MPAQEESEPSKEGPGEKKRGLEITPEMFIENPDAKRLREQELAYRTLKKCVVELRMATNAVNEAARVIGNHQDIGEAIGASQVSVEAQREGFAGSTGAFNIRLVS